MKDEERAFRGGMSLRQWYAGMVIPQIVRCRYALGKTDWADLADEAFAQADAMIEREKKL